MSANTVRSYRDTFVLFLRFCRDERKKEPSQLAIHDLDARLVTDFLDHLERDRRCSIPTRNQRLAAIHSFARFAQTECPETLIELQRVLLIPAKRHERREVSYLRGEEMAAILQQPGMDTQHGRRDTTLLSLLYDTGARVQELIDVKVKDVRLETPAQIRLTGKGRKTRSVPILPRTVTLLADYLEEHDLGRPECREWPLFRNRHGGRLTRSGVRHILCKHAERARTEQPSLPERLSPHVLRHTKAMHLLQAGNPLVVIGNILGHVCVSTTEVYAKADMTMKRRALESVAHVASPPEPPSWQRDKNLIDWLKSL
jgi:site-specific recombinase XerD